MTLAQIKGTGGLAGVSAPSFQRREAPLNIGVLAPSYGLEHVSYGIPSDVIAFHQLRAVTARRLFPKNGFVAHTPFLLGAHCDLVHSFNHLPLNRPFVVSFEMELPRNIGNSLSWQDGMSYRLLTGSRCRQILSLSAAARQFFLSRVPDALRDSFEAKTCVFRGMVTAATNGTTRAPLRQGAPLKLLFVGGDGLRKGLGPVVTAFERLVAAGADMDLTIVGQPRSTNYVLPGHELDPAPLIQRIADHPRITHYPSTPNETVKMLMASHHVFLLPTIDESLGWVVVEAGLSGMAVIATDVFAIPELVQDCVTGCLIQVEKRADHRWVHLETPSASNHWEATQEDFAIQIMAALNGMIERPDRVATYGAAARAHLESMYGAEVAHASLLKVYRAAVGPVTV